MTGPRPLPDPGPVFRQVVTTIVIAALVGGGVAWWLTRGWPR